MIADLLSLGDEVRVIAPATGIKIVSPDCLALAKQRFESLGLKVSFGKNTTDANWDSSGSTSIEKRIEDIHQAFLDKNVKAIFTIIGGSNSNQLLDYIDYEIIKKNPKIFCGFSDITTLLNAIYAKTGLITFSGPHFSSFGMLKGVEYTVENMQKMLMQKQKDENNIHPSPEWSDDLWFIDQQNRHFIRNEGYWLLQDGQAEGKLIGGNLGSFNLLLGTAYRPEFTADTILFIEDTQESSIADFTRNFQAILQQPDFKNVKGILIGRFQQKSNIDKQKLQFMIERFKPYLSNLPIMANLDFGHSTPLLTIPLGGYATISSESISLRLRK